MKFSSVLVFALFVVMWQGCDDNKSEQQGGIRDDDGGIQDSSVKSDSGSGQSKDAGDDGAGSGGSGGTSGSGGEGDSAGAGGEGVDTGGAGNAGAPAAGAGGMSGAGESVAGAAASGAGSGGAAGTAEAGAGGSAGAGETAGAGGESGTGAEAGSGGDAGSGDAGEPSDSRCGTRGGATCGDAQFCNFQPEPNQECGGTDRGGVCEDKPQICNDLYEPVCGCDNRTHANVCFTHLDGVSLKHEGLCTRAECSSAGGHAVLSDGASQPTCGQGERSWSIDSGGDEPAVCCVQEQSSGRTCGGIAALQCDTREFCNYEASAGGQGCDGTVSDAGGICQAVPTVCTREYNPVCGCDKKSYSNACEAHSVGVAILHEGACTELDCASVAGRVVYAPGPAAMCAPGENEWTFVVNSSGSMAIEGAICCRQQ
ncbi:MAG TPA: Kazal-type serine protease inhibitor domain-containing protein [Polyangiales bacterium]|nr:Kazal-type serine protease inhibitor domain-containing protein [Polyangiales bacterium]